MHQVTIWATITPSTPGTLAAIIADSDDGHPAGSSPPADPVTGTSHPEFSDPLPAPMRLSHNPVQPFGRRPQWSVDPILWASGAAEWRSSTEHAAQNELDFSRSRVVQQPPMWRGSSVIMKARPRPSRLAARNLGRWRSVDLMCR
jgi:hypothetical protein